MSPRAAARLETLGFERVYDYTPGKADWLAAGLPVEGEDAGETRAVDLARTDVPTCRLSEPAGAVRKRMDEAGIEVCPVVNAERVLLGLVHREQAAGGEGDTAGDVMQEGPKTVRPDASPQSPLDYMRENDVEHVVVTTNFGRLLGVLTRPDLERFAEREAS